MNDSLEELVTIPSSSRGRCFFDCIILLKAIYDAVRVNPRNFSISSFSNATTLEESSTQEITIAANDLLSSGKYIVRLADGAPLCLSWTVRDIYPVGIVGRALTAEEMILIETELVAEDKRSTLLKLKVSQRDHVCLLSGRAGRVTLAHIFARAWCQNTTNRMVKLRREDCDRILTVGVDSPANGMLLAPVHAAAFDDGLFAIRLNESRQYEVLAISPEYMDFDKYLLYDGKRAEEIGLPGIPPMDSALLEFQLKCAVLRNMKAAAEPVDLLLQDNDELDEIADELLKRGNLSPETIKSGLNWGVVERALNYTSKENAFKPASFAILKDPAGGELTDANTSGSSDE